MQFSSRIAEEWELPSPIVVALEEQLSPKRARLATILHEANTASEIHMMVQADKITFEQGKRLFVRMGLQEDLIFAMYGGL
jgi:HD-like signal output (HDOD) protein